MWYRVSPADSHRLFQLKSGVNSYTENQPKDRKSVFDQVVGLYGYTVIQGICPAFQITLPQVSAETRHFIATEFGHELNQREFFHGYDWIRRLYVTRNHHIWSISLVKRLSSSIQTGIPLRTS